MLYHPTLLWASLSTTKLQNTNKKALPIKRLTPDQMDERRAKGLYFNWDDKFYKGRICKAKMFAIAITNDDQDMSEEVKL